MGYSSAHQVEGAFENSDREFGFPAPQISRDDLRCSRVHGPAVHTS